MAIFIKKKLQIKTHTADLEAVGLKQSIPMTQKLICGLKKKTKRKTHTSDGICLAVSQTKHKVCLAVLTESVLKEPKTHIDDTTLHAIDRNNF